MRKALEVFSIKKLCQDYEKIDGSILKDCLNEQKHAVKSQDAERFMEADRKFHIGLTMLTENNYLMDMMNEIRDIIHLMGFKALGLEGRMEQVVNEHEEILKAVAKGDADKAMEQMENHLELSKIAANKTKEEEK